MANEIDALMDLDPLTLNKTPGAIEGLIALLRNRRAQHEAGVKLKRDTGPKQDLSALLGIKAEPVTVKRRI